MSVFAARLIQLQTIDGPAYAAQARDSRLRTVALPATRGDILDTNGAPLATTVDTVAIAADPKFTAPVADQIAGIVAPVLGVDTAGLLDKLNRPGTRFVYLARQVDQGVWNRIRTSLATAGLRGVTSEADPMRSYPAGSTAASIIGFTGTDTAGLVGRDGLEAGLNGLLAGKAGSQTFEVSADGPALPLGDDSLTAPVAGTGVQLSIDRDLQFRAQQMLAEQVRRNRAESGDAIVMDVRTGQVVVMATAPTYDANAGARSPADLRRDRPISDSFEPGSVFKLVTASAALDQGKVTPATREVVPAYLHRDGQRIKDWWRHGTLRMTFAGAIAKSSNIGTILAASQLSHEVQADYLHRFGIGAPTGVPLPGENTGSVPAAADWTGLTQATISFGQGVAVNALQMASVVATVANGGVRIPPQLVKGYVAADGTITPAPAPVPTRVIQPQTAAQLMGIMQQVTAPSGTAPKVNIPGYVSAGKSGTAQRFDKGCRCYHNYTVSFALAAPAEAPRYIAYVDLKNVGGAASGGGSAGPVAKKLLGAVLHANAVPPSTKVRTVLPLTW